MKHVLKTNAPRRAAGKIRTRVLFFVDIFQGNGGSAVRALAMRWLSIAVISMFAGFGDPPEARARESVDRTGSFNLTEENDSLYSTVDKHYTQGLRLSIASGEVLEGARTSIADRTLIAPRSADSVSRYRYGFSIGQSIFTPENVTAVVPDPIDRPYAGWLYAGATLYRESETMLDRVEIALGLIGPDAEAEQVQNGWHNFAGSYLRLRRVNGWDAQLHNEPGLMVLQERKWRFAESGAGFDFDLLPEVNVVAGNVFTYAAVGFVARAGQRISVDWGPPRIQPSISGSDFVNLTRLNGRGFAWYFFAGTEGRAVARNIFLDGNSFESSARVRRQPFVADLTGGMAVIFRNGRATLSYVRRTREFETQIGQDEFLSITLSLSI